MTLASLARTRSCRVAAAYLIVLSALVLIPGGPAAEADGIPDISLAKSQPAEALAGDPAIRVTLTATNGGGPDGFNLTFVDVLPSSATLGVGSPAPDQTLAGTPTSGFTTYVWRNVSDLQTGVSESLTYFINASAYDVGSSFTTTGRAYVSDDPFVIPTYTGTGGSGYDENVSVTTSMLPFLLFKTEPNTEAELLRGLHDHQTVYTLEIRNNYIGTTHDFAIEDWIPASMEFLGCGGVDNSSGVEYTGSGAINPGNEPTLSNPCVAPDVVETVVADPPGAPPSGVYTHVVWTAATLATDVGAGDSAFFDYIAAIPMRANALWPDPAPDTDGPQASNIDNNTGALTEETLTEQQVQNYAVATGDYPTAGATTYSDGDTMTVSAEDVSIHKSVDNSSITHGAGSGWTLTIEASEYTDLASGIIVTDTVPDGLCPTQASGPGCTGTDPTQPYSSLVENTDGTWTITWNVADMDGSAPTTTDVRTITFYTETLTHYQENGSNQSPVLAQDSWTNTVALTATADGRPVEDSSSASQSAADVTISKDVATRVASMNDCSAVIDWSTDPALGYRIGDRVCWRLGVDFPIALDTFDSDIQDYLPPGHFYTDADTWTLGAANTVAAGDVSGPPRDAEPHPADLTALTWSVGDGSGYVAEDEYLEIIFSSTILDPQATSSGEINANLMKYSYENTAGKPFNLRDDADAEAIEPELSLIKGVVAVNGAPTGDPNFNNAFVMEGDDVTYQITVTNTGDLDANDVEVWDELPLEYDACSSNVIGGSISDGGTCNDIARRIEWTGANTVTVPAGGSIALTYIIDFPTGIAPNESLVNTAGVRTFTSVTNNGTGSFVYVPSNNIDTSLSAGENTDPADDTARVRTLAPTIGKTRTSSVAEAGNDSTTEATIGEIITYVSTVVIPEGTTVHAPTWFSDALPINLDLVSSSFTFDGAATPILAEDFATETVTVSFAADYTNAPGTGADTLEVTIEARVLDVPQNQIDDTITNEAFFYWDSHDGTDRSISDSVATTVVEPQISITKTSVDSFGDDDIVVGGELVDYTLALRNSNGTNVSTAHDLVVVDTLPTGVTPTIINNGGVWAAGPRTITWSVASLAPNATVNLTYQVSIDDPVVVSSVFTNTVVADATSMAGAATGERTSGTGYQATSGVTLDSPLASIAKSVIPTTGTIGDDLTYTIVVTIPPGTIMYDATVLDVMPAGIVFDGIASTTCVMGGGACLPAVAVQHLYSSGTTNSFFLGDLPTSSAQTRVLTIVYDAHVGDLGSAGDTRTNGATIYGNTSDVLAADPGFVAGPFDVSTGPAEATVTLEEPTLAIDKNVSAPLSDDYRRAKPGDTLYYTLSVSNSGNANTAPAYDITVVDVVPVGFGDPTLISNGGVWASGPRTITWTLAGPLNAGTGQALSYGVTVDPALDWTDENPGGAELVNTADIPSYFGVPETERTANPAITYREYDNVVEDQVRVELDLAQIGDYVWFDVDGDGAQDGAEPPLAGIGLTVTYHGPNGTLGDGDDEVFTVTTAADGSYHVDHLPGGVYTVVVTATDLPAGLISSYNFDGTLDHTWSGTLIENGNEARVDFGYTGTGSIGDTIWFDIDGDGTFDGSEYGLEGVALTVTWLGSDGLPGGGDDAVYATTTDANGNYLVEDLPAGEYIVAVDPASLPAGMSATFDADGVGVPLNQSALTLGGNEDNLDQDFGYAGTGSIGDFVWLDSNGDGTQDAGEPGLIGVPVQLTWPGEDGVLGGGDDEIFLTTTDGSGSYRFDNLPPGEYQIDVLGGLPAAATNTFDRDGNGNSSTVVTLGSGVDLDTVDFGYQGSASIGDTVWWDRNGDGAFAVGEPGLPGVAVTLTYAGLDGVLGNSDDLSFTTATDADGNYLFTDLPQGNYAVAVTGSVPSGMAPTYDETGPLDETSLVSGLTVLPHLTADFGYNGTGSIGDFVWLDRNSDGVQDGDEPGLPGVDVYLIWYGVDGSEGTSDDVTSSTTTDIDGNYLFPNLPAGGYDVVIDPLTLPPGVVATDDPDGVTTPDFASLNLAAGNDDLAQDFGYVGTAAVGDTIWFDRNADGVFDADEYGIGSVALDVIWAGPNGIFGDADDETFATTTDLNGDYVVAGLPAGDYNVVVDPGTLPSGMAATFDEDGTLDDETTFTLAAGEAHLSADFGYNGSGEIGDFVWLDLNGDGTQDAGEPGIPGQTVELTWAGADGVLGTADDQVFTTVTDADGKYLFDNLPPGQHEVEVIGSILGVAINTADEDGDDDSHTTVTLGDGASHLTADFGYQGSAEIGDLVWLDLDDNGTADAGEPGLPGVEVTITWYGDDGVPGGGDDIVLPVFTTDADGNYLATGLPDSAYGVEVTAGIPAGLTNNADEDADLDSQTDVSGLTAGSSHLTADFGYVGSGSIGDTIWWDLDDDGAQGANEPGFAGIDVTLTWAGLDGVLGTSDDAVFTTTTDADGMYLFEDLPPGDYSVVVDEADLPAGVTQSGDPDATLDGASAVTLGPDETNLDQDFGYRGDGSVGDFVWFDLSNDGVQDATEPGVPGVGMTVTYLGADGVAGGGDDVSFLTVTDADGLYTVPGLPSGFYTVSVDSGSLPAGTTVTADLDGSDPVMTSFSLGADEDKTDVDYPVVGNASLSGTVWNDVDGDQLAGSGEVGIPAVTVLVTWDGPTGPVVISVVSGPDGFWDMPTLPPGDYTVAIDLSTVPDGMTATTPTEAAVTLPSGGHEDVDFGLAETVDLGSTVWIDTDGDGVVDPDETGIPEVLVNLFNGDGALVDFTETDGEGRYLFEGLLPGLYLVQIDPVSLPEDVLATWDRDGSPDLNTLVTLTGGLSILDANFGFQVGLPTTGLEVRWFAIWGSLLLLAGAGLALAAALRRRFSELASVRAA